MMLAGQMPDPSQRMEALPTSFNYSKKSVAPPAYVSRVYEVPTTGSGSYYPGSLIKFDIGGCGSPGVHLNPAETQLVFSIFNNSGMDLYLSGGAHSMIDSIDVYHGGQHLESICAVTVPLQPNNTISSIATTTPDISSLNDQFIAVISQ